MNIDRILQTLHDGGVDYLLIGGVNFMLHHAPELTFDVDIWAANESANRDRLNRALKALKAEWGATEASWAPVPADPSWLLQQTVYCLTTEHGALDVFWEVQGLEGRYAECKTEARLATTAAGAGYQGLSDRHMLDCQLALPPSAQKAGRIATLRKALHGQGL